ncbi:MAG: protein-disulfide reductase DsbD family protein [Burkholderiaceae bacterium]
MDRFLASWLPGLRRSALWFGAALMVLLLLLRAGPVHAQSRLLDVVRATPAIGAQRVDALEIEWVADRQAVAAGETLWLALRLKHDPDWHTYWQNPGDSGLPTTLRVEGLSGAAIGDLMWPVPMRLWVGPLANYGYEGEVLLPMQLKLPATWADGQQTVALTAQASWLICREVCIPGEARLALEIPIRSQGDPVRESSHAEKIRQALAQVPDPAKALTGQWVRHAGGVALSVTTAPSSAAVIDPAQAQQTPRTVEFFPARAGWLSAPAPQRLLHQEGGWRLELVPVDGARIEPGDVIEGALRIDSRIVWLRAGAGRGGLPEGRLVSVADRPTGARAHADGQAAPLDPGTWVIAMLLAAIGGLILNLMPCVFPVVGLKLASLAGGDPHSPAGRAALRSGLWAFVLGILVCFAALAGLMIGLRSAGAAIGWGFQLQSPVFVAGMALLFIAVGLNFSGVFEIGMSLTRLGQLEVNRPAPPGEPSGTGAISRPVAQHRLSAFLSGVLAVLVATPCTAPFMGSAVGLTLTMPGWAALGVFLAVGAGMALPYLLLGWWPQALSRLPRPGPWMQTLRSLLAFPMYASAAWLVWVLAQQSGPDAVLNVLLAGVALALAAWAWHRRAFARTAGMRTGWSLVTAGALALTGLLWSSMDATTAPERAAPGTAAQASGATSATPATAQAPEQAPVWTPWSEAGVRAALESGRPVFVDFTAAWCVSCQANKKLVLETTKVRQAFAAQGVALFRADWTRQDPLITAELARHGRNGVPLYLVYLPAGATPRILPELLTVATVIEALQP